MFGLFGKKEKGITTNEQVWLSQKAKLNAAYKMMEPNRSTLVVFWFEDSWNDFQKQVTSSTSSSQISLAETLSLEFIAEKIVIFAEHYPLRKKEQALFERLHLKEVPILVSLEEPFFHYFGGDRTIDIMRKMGVQENEVIAHAMITRSLQNAQEKIEKEVVTERKANSAKEWFQLNMGALNQTA